MIHSVPGPVSAETLLAEANWALDVYKEAKLKSGDQQIQFVAWSHQQASWAPNGNRDRKVHELLASRPMPKLQWVYEEVFEKILGEKVSEAGPRLAQAATRLEYARKTGRPILFVNPMHVHGFEALGKKEALDIVKAMAAHATQDRFVYHHQWQVGDVLVWDEQATMHRGAGDSPEGERRVLLRTIVYPN